MKTVIMAGGRGTRIASVYSDIPKPMIPIDGVPVLEREIVSLRDQGFTDIVLTLSYLPEKIMDYFKDGSSFGVKIEYFVEKEPLGNAGALFKLMDQLNEDFLLLNGDVLFDVDFNRMVKYHKEKGALVTLFTHPNSHPYDSGLLIANDDMSVRAWLSKEDDRPEFYKNRVNAGLHIISPDVLKMSGIDPELVGSFKDDGKTVKVDLDRQLLKPLSGSGRMFCYDSPEYVHDMGTPERLNQVESDVKNGISSSRNLVKKQKAFFLDRDGTINRYVGFLRTADQMELLEGAAEAIRKVNRSEYLCIVVTNQPVIARGEVSYKELEEIHNKMETLLGKEGAYIDALYFCPHHPHSGFEGEIKELKIDCDCRKPKPGMLVKAAKDYNIDLTSSFMIGDSESDIQAGEAAGCQSYKIDSENDLLKIVSDLLEEK